jgi:hypothetical protein
MVMQAEQALYESLQGALRGRAAITLGVAHRELLVDQVPVAQGGATARELAGRLHRRGVGAITLSAGLSLDAVQRALTWLAHDPNATATRAAPARRAMSRRSPVPAPGRISTATRSWR